MLRKTAIVLCIVLVALCFVQLTFASDDSTYSVHEYPLPPGSGEIGAMTVDSSGNVWLIQNSPPALYKFLHDNGTFYNYTLKGFARAAFTGLTVDETGIAWFTDLTSDGFGAYDEKSNQTLNFPFHSWNDMAPSSILRRGDSIWIGCNAEFGEYDLRFPDEPLLDHFVYHWDSYLQDIHFDRFNNVWAVEYAKNNVSVYWRMYDKTSEFAIPTGNSYPTCLSIDSLGRLWFVESATNKLGMFHTELFNFSEYEMPPIDGEKPQISRVATVDDAVWLTDLKNDQVLRFFPDEDRFAAAKLAKGAAPTFISADGNGTLWIYEASSKKLASLDVTDQFGQATPTPGPTATEQPSASATPKPAGTPGFLAFFPLTAITLALLIRCARNH